jgi:hypothetical protein
MLNRIWKWACRTFGGGMRDNAGVWHPWDKGECEHESEKDERD